METGCILMTMELRAYQQAAVAAVLHEWDEGNNKTLCVMATGCHAIGQKLLLANGKIKKVEDISSNDMLMGDDGNPRKVLNIIHGTGRLYRIIPIKGNPFIVDENHMLTLIRTPQDNHPKCPSRARGREIIDVTVKEWLSWSKTKKHLYKLLRSSAIENFSNNNYHYDLDAYFLGILLGDGGLNGASVNITTPEPEVVKIIKEQSLKYNLSIRTTPAGKATTYHFSSKEKWKRNDFIKQLNLLGLRHKLSNDKSVPFQYKLADITTRLDVIAGLLDSDGSLTCSGYDFISKSKTLADDLAYMCRSVGLAAYVKSCKKQCNNFTGIYYRVSISGDCSIIPNRVLRKKAPKRQQKKNVLVTGFSVEYYKYDKYIGFTVDGNNRYVMGDFTITHNCGKTIVFAKVTENQVRLGERVLILAHRGELLDQAADKIYKTTGLRCSVEKAEQSCLQSWNRVVVGSVQTLTREKRLNMFPPNYFDTIIVDEAHHIISKSYLKVMNHFPNANVLGVTATSDRADMKNLGTFFDSLAFEYGMAKAIKEGYLCKIMAQTIPLNIDIRSVGMSAGDFKAGDLGTALDPYLESIAAEMERVCADRKTVVFLPLVATSQKFRDILNEHGFKAAEINGESTDRKEILQDFDQGKYNVLCNSMLLTEGWDCPSVDCIVCLRATKSRSLYQQIVGRGTRLNEGKDHLLLLDFLWMTERHDLCRPANLITGSIDIAKKMTEKLAENAGPMELEELEQDAETDVVREREEALAEQLSMMKKRKRKLVDPLQFAMSIQAEDLANYVPNFPWELEPASPKQLEVLEKFGIFPDEVENAGKAKMIMDKLTSRKDAGLATPKQIRLLESRGFQHVGTWQFSDATKMISRISACGWRIPKGVSPAKFVPESMERRTDI